MYIIDFLPLPPQIPFSTIYKWGFQGVKLTWRRDAFSARYRSGHDSVMFRAFASEAGGAGSNPGRVIPKTLRMVPVATLLGAQHYKASTGFSSLKTITSMMGAPCNTLFMRYLEYLADSDSDVVQILKSKSKII